MGRDRELPPPLEMMCLNALWDITEGNVEDVRRVVSQERPLAYTTVLTLLDRLTRRGAVSRRKEGRGFRYQPVADRNKVRRLALKLFLEHHFGGSEAKLKLFLETETGATAAPLLTHAAAAGESGMTFPAPVAHTQAAVHTQAMATAVGAQLPSGSPAPLPPRE